ncbi:TRAP transporter large permease [Microbacterium soli]|uniref:TRAP transporter large permease n=1 Tax=Microbacterium soli TaxID=446075 RepID=A0ABP7MMR5_9MICO
MSTEIVIVLTILVFVALMAMRVPIALALLTGSTIGILILSGSATTQATLGALPYSATAKYALVVIPMYVLLGSLIANSGVGAGIYRVMNVLLRRLPGGLPATAVAATAMFSGISGSTAADVASFGRISIQEMSKFGYSRHYAAAVVAAAGTFAVLIPPSIILVVYGVLAEVSIAAMILGAVIPGAVSCFVLIAWVVLTNAVGPRAKMAARQPALVGAAGGIDADLASADVEPARADRTPTSEGWRSLRGADAMSVAYTVLLFGVVVGGLAFGIFTVTEAGAVGAFAALIIAIIARRNPGQSIGKLIGGSIRETAGATSMIFLLLIAGAVFTYFAALTSIPARIAEWVSTLPVEPLAVVGIMLLLLIPIGMFLDGLSTMLLFVPIAAPVVMELGFDGVWFGILAVKLIEIGLITPPVGLNVFIAAGIGKVRAERVFLSITPFVILDLVITAGFFIFPDLILWLPRIAGAL